MTTSSKGKAKAAHRKEGTLESRRISAGKKPTPEQDAAAAKLARKVADAMDGFSGLADFLRKAEAAAELAREIGHVLSEERAARLLWDVMRVRKALDAGADRFAILAAIDAALIWAQLNQERRTSESLKKHQKITADKYNRARRELIRQGKRALQSSIAEKLGVSDQALRNWLKAYSNNL